MQASAVVHSILFTVLMFSHNYITTVITMFMFGLMSSLRMQVGFPYLMELVPRCKRTYYGTLINVLDGLITMLGVAYFCFVSKDWFYFVGVGYILNLSTTISVFKLPESPAWLIQMQRYDDARETLETIAKFNNTKLKSFDTDYFP
jgi:MFS family permease